MNAAGETRGRSAARPLVSTSGHVYCSRCQHPMHPEEMLDFATWTRWLYYRCEGPQQHVTEALPLPADSGNV